MSIMNKSDTLVLAQQLSQSDQDTCGTVVQSLMLTRGLSKLVRALDELVADPVHGSVAKDALKKIGFAD